jgi:hypothetical protein
MNCEDIQFNVYKILNLKFRKIVGKFVSQVPFALRQLSVSVDKSLVYTLHCCAVLNILLLLPDVDSLYN